MNTHRSDSEYTRFIADAADRKIISPTLANALLRIGRDENPLNQAMAAWSAVKMLIPLEEQAGPFATYQTNVAAAKTDKDEADQALRDAEDLVRQTLQRVYKDPAQALENLHRLAKSCTPQGQTVDVARVEEELNRRPELLGSLNGLFSKKQAEQEFRSANLPDLAFEYFEHKTSAGKAASTLKALQAAAAEMHQAGQADAAVSAVREAVNQLDIERAVNTKGIALHKRLYQVMEVCVFRDALPHHLEDAPEAAKDLPFGRILKRVVERNLSITFAANPDALEIKRLKLSAEVLHDCVVDARDIRANEAPDSYPAKRAIAWTEAHAKTAYNDVLARAKEIYGMIDAPPSPPPPPGGGSSGWELVD